MNDVPDSAGAPGRFVFKGGTAQILAVSPLPEGIDPTQLQIRPITVGKKPASIPFHKKPLTEP